MSGERRRWRAFWRSVTDDPYRKLTAIGLAILMWFFIDSRITKTITREIPLRIAGASEGEGLAIALPTDRVIERGFLNGDEPITTVELVMSGPRFRIEALEAERLNLVITEFKTLDTTRRPGDAGKTRFLEFTAANIQLDQRLRDVDVVLNPRRVRLEYEVKANLNVDLDRAVAEGLVEIVADGLADRLRLDTAVYTPESARVVGPAFALEQLQQRGGPLFRVRLRAAGNERRVSTPLEIIGGEDLGLRFDPTPVLNMELLPQTSAFAVRLPVLIDDLSLPEDQRGRYEPERASYDVRVRVAGELRSRMTLLSEGTDTTNLDEWVAENLRLLVYVPRQPSGLPPELSPQARVVTADLLLDTGERSECSLESPLIVKLLLKK